MSCSSEVARDRGKRSLADFGRSGSDRGVESLDVGESETAFADSRSFLPYPASHSSQVARVINTVTAAGGLSRASAEACLTLTQAPGSDGSWTATRLMKSLLFHAHSWVGSGNFVAPPATASNSTTGTAPPACVHDSDSRAAVSGVDVWCFVLQACSEDLVWAIHFFGFAVGELLDFPDLSASSFGVLQVLAKE